ncbi:MAG TPA: hypothetical protein VGG51_13875 [Candidatus Cybelea sp.]|jgi:hypothetical protein
MNAESLHERLCHLLEERRRLRKLIAAKLAYSFAVNNLSAEPEAQAAVLELVIGPLDLDTGELPFTTHVSQAVVSLLVMFGKPEYVEHPELVWNRATIVPGVQTREWHAHLKERLQELCGPLDVPIKRLCDDCQ